jgi:hypothetical protein
MSKQIIIKGYITSILYFTTPISQMEICNGISDLLFHMLTLMTFLLPADYEYYWKHKKVGHQISVSFQEFDVVQALLSICL